MSARKNVSEWDARMGYIGGLPPHPDQHQYLLPTAAPAHDGIAWHHAQLKPPLATARLPRSEAIVSLGLVAVVALVVMGLAGWAWWAVLGGVLAVAAMAYVLWDRRVIVGADFIAVRQLGRYHFATFDADRPLRLHPSRHGEVVVVDTDDGRHLRIREAEVADPAVNDTLHGILDKGEAVADERVETLIAVQRGQPGHRFLADLFR